MVTNHVAVAIADARRHLEEAEKRLPFNANAEGATCLRSLVQAVRRLTDAVDNAEARDLLRSVRR